MPTETKKELNQDTLEALEDLIRANIDAADGFAEASKQVADPNLSNLFADMSSQRRALASQLQTHVAQSGERSRGEGTWLGTLHRAWINVRSRLSSGDAHVILCEVERAEDSIKHAYEDVLLSTAGSAMNAVFTEQYSVVKAGHDHIRDLRDQSRS